MECESMQEIDENIEESSNDSDKDSTENDEVQKKKYIFLESL